MSKLAQQYGVLGYLEADNFTEQQYHEEFLRDIEEEIGRNSKAPFVRNCHIIQKMVR